MEYIKLSDILKLKSPYKEIIESEATFFTDGEI